MSGRLALQKTIRPGVEAHDITLLVIFFLALVANCDCSCFVNVIMSLMPSDDEDLITDHGPVPSRGVGVGTRASSGGDAEERRGLLEGVDDDDDDDFFLTGPRMAPAVAADVRLSGIRQQVREITEVMQDNVGRLMERGDRLDDLDERSQRLGMASEEFRSASLRVKKRMWWQNMSAKLAVGGAAGVVVVVLIIIAVS